MKICQLCAVDFTLQKFLTPLIDAQTKRGFDVISVCSDGPYIEELRTNGYTIENIKISRNLNVFKHLHTIWKLYRYFSRESFDIVHVHTPIAGLIGRIAAYFARVPLVIYTAHGFYFHDDMPFLKRNVFIILEKIGAKFTDIIFTQSEEDSEAAVSLGIMGSKDVFHIGNGVDISRFKPSNGLRTKIFEIPDDAFVVGMVGRLVEEKGIVQFLEAAVAASKIKLNLYFVLIGERLDSDHASSVEKIISKSKCILKHRLILTGLRDDIPSLLAGMDIFCLPSWREGMPRTIIEAMLMGLPVIATDIRGSREEVIDRETGILVPAKDSESLSHAIIELSSNTAMCQEMGFRGRERALKLYDETLVVKRQIDIIDTYIDVMVNTSR